MRLTTSYLKYLPSKHRHITSVLTVNNIIQMNIWMKITWKNIFPSDLRKLPC